MCPCRVSRCPGRNYAFRDLPIAIAASIVEAVGFAKRHGSAGAVCWRPTEVAGGEWISHSKWQMQLKCSSTRTKTKGRRWLRRCGSHVVDDRYVWVSPSLKRILGWSVSDWIGQPTTLFTDQADDDAASEARARLQRGETASIRRRVQDAAGAWHWVDATAHTYRDEEGRANGYTVSLRIVDREMEIAAELQRRARYDDLTGVLKREEAIARLTALGSQRRRPGGLPAVLFLDVDEFKQVNDTYGHLAGDALLTELAVRIRQCVRHNDVIARMGGDEFLVILEGIHDVQDVARIAENIRASAARPIVTGGHIVHATASIGITLSELGEDADAVIARADDAMYRAKRHGRNQVVALWD